MAKKTLLGLAASAFSLAPAIGCTVEGAAGDGPVALVVTLPGAGGEMHRGSFDEVFAPLLDPLVTPIEVDGVSSEDPSMLFAGGNVRVPIAGDRAVIVAAGPDDVLTVFDDRALGTTMITRSGGDAVVLDSAAGAVTIDLDGAPDQDTADRILGAVVVRLVRQESIDPGCEDCSLLGGSGGGLICDALSAAMVASRVALDECGLGDYDFEVWRPAMHAEITRQVGDAWWVHYAYHMPADVVLDIAIIGAVGLTCASEVIDRCNGWFGS